MAYLTAEYPHWVMRPELKAYYLVQASFWMQQAFVMLLGLERPRKDYYELIAHVSPFGLSSTSLRCGSSAGLISLI